MFKLETSVYFKLTLLYDNYNNFFNFIIIGINLFSDAMHNYKLYEITDLCC